MQPHLTIRLLKALGLSILLFGLYGCGELSTSDDNALVDTDDSTSETEADNHDETNTTINLALNQQATQSSVAFNGEASRAVDGNTDGAYKNKSVTHTDPETEAWWQVDLGSVEYISYINIYNRTDNCCSARLSDFYVLISETPFVSNDLSQSIEQSNITSFHINSEVNGSKKINVKLDGRYVRVQQVGSGNSISLAEVEVMFVEEDIDTITPDEPIESTNPDGEVEENDTEEKSQELIDYESGKAIYEAKCSNCHLTLENSLKHNSTEAQLREAVLNISAMQNIALTDQEYQLLELVLNNEAPVQSDTENDSSSEALPASLTLLARITNDEFVNSAMTLLTIENTESIESAKERMGAESNVLGLLNDASTQLVTQVALSGYINMIDTLVNAYFETVTTNDEMSELYNCEGNLLDCGKLVTNQIAEKAFRRALTEEEILQINSLFDAVTVSYTEEDLEADQNDTVAHQIRFRSAMYYILLSPDFLFLIETGTDEVDSNGELYLSSQEIATRMAFFLTGNLPDEALLAAVEENNLQDPVIRAEHTDRLLDSRSGEQQIANVLRAWLDIKDDLEESSSNSLDAFLLDWVANNRPFSDLYQAPVDVKNVDGSTTVEPLGILGLHAFVASHTEPPSPSFIHRGMFVVERLLCESLPDDIPAEALESGELSELEAFEVHSQDECASCHRVFDNYGAAFQQFDSETSLFDINSNILGSSFDLYDIGDVVNEVSNLSDLSTEMAGSQTASACMAELWYRDALRRNINSNDSQALAHLINEWESSQDMSIKSLLKAIVTSDVFITLYL